MLSELESALSGHRRLTDTNAGVRTCATEYELVAAVDADHSQWTQWSAAERITERLGLYSCAVHDCSAVTAQR
jgi:hypothetical protein